MFRWGNYDAVNANVRWNSAEVPSGLAKYPQTVPPDHNLPPSFYLSAKPAWFGTTPWPAIGPDVSGGNIANVGGHAFKIPAQRCYESTPMTAGILNFNANNCYTISSGTLSAPTSLRIIRD